MLREILMALLVTSAAPTDGLEDARRLLQNGRYAEAQEAYEAHLEKENLAPPVKAKAVLGHADSLAAQGEVEKALEAVLALAKDQPENADLTARIADLKLSRGDWPGADEAAKQALKADSSHIGAKWVEARLLEARGE